MRKNIDTRIINRVFSDAIEYLQNLLDCVNRDAADLGVNDPDGSQARRIIDGKQGTINLINSIYQEIENKMRIFIGKTDDLDVISWLIEQAEIAEKRAKSTISNLNWSIACYYASEEVSPYNF